MAAVEETTRRVRQLLLSGDNALKSRDDEARFGRARERFETARRLAHDAGLGTEITTIIDRRLEALTDAVRP